MGDILVRMIKGISILLYVCLLKTNLYIQLTIKYHTTKSSEVFKNEVLKIRNQIFKTRKQSQF
jgi:hypothetical protein